MKILIIAGIFPPDIGGPANYVPKLSTALSLRGHYISILCFSDQAHHESDKHYGFPIYRIIRNQNIIFREALTIYKGLQLAKKHDVIYSNGNDFKAMIISWLTGKPRVHKIVGDTSWERAQNKSWFKGSLDEYQVSKKSFVLQILDWARSFPLRKASAVIVPSWYLHKIVSGWDVETKKIKMIYNSFEPLPKSSDHFSDATDLFFSDSEMAYMITVCRLVAWKGVDTLIKILQNFPRLCFIIVGDGPLEMELKNIAITLGVANRVFFAGRKKRTEIEALISKSDFFILNSSYEGLPHVVLESMSSQKLVLASSAGGTTEVVQDQTTGLLFEYNNPTSISKAINQALCNDNQIMIENANNMIAKNFSFDRMLAETETVLQNIADSN